MKRYILFTVFLLAAFFGTAQSRFVSEGDISTEPVNRLSISDTKSEVAKLYPNPAIDFFQIMNDELVAKVIIYNVIGKKMMTQLHIVGQSHDIDNLRNGLYLVRLLDDQDNILKVVRMNKK